MYAKMSRLNLAGNLKGIKTETLPVSSIYISAIDLEEVFTVGYAFTQNNFFFPKTTDTKNQGEGRLKAKIGRWTQRNETCNSGKMTEEEEEEEEEDNR